LPAGKYGQPSLLIREGWAEKGVAFAIVQALDRKSLLLFVLVLVVSALFLANGAFASVRSRRQELGVLRCLGWSRRMIFRAVLVELILVGAIAGLAGTAMAVMLAAALGLHVPVLRTTLVLPVAVLLTVASGVVPAWRASRGSPLDAVLPSISVRGGGMRVRGLTAMALADLGRQPARTMIGALGLVIGVASLAVLFAITLAFRGVVVGTLLGSFVSVQVRGVDYLSAALAIGLGAFSVADVLALNARERAPELAAVRAGGWSASNLARLVMTEGFVAGVAGSVAGGAIGAGIGALLGADIVPLVNAALLAAGVGVIVAALASTVPSAMTARLSLARVLAEE
jgi:ABC-type antimicrobial peptide transport system permease subunit